MRDMHRTTLKTAALMAGVGFLALAVRLTHDLLFGSAPALSGITIAACLSLLAGVSLLGAGLHTLGVLTVTVTGPAYVDVTQEPDSPTPIAGTARYDLEEKAS